MIQSMLARYFQPKEIPSLEVQACKTFSTCFASISAAVMLQPVSMISACQKLALEFKAIWSVSLLVVQA